MPKRSYEGSFNLNEPNPLLKATNKSGFPLQIAVEQLVTKTASSHGWRVRNLEHAWFHPHIKEGGFIDLVLQKDTSNLVIECKRVREASWLFLRSDGSEKEQNRCKGWASWYARGSMKAFDWYDLKIEPSCVEVMFCTNHGKGAGGAQGMLEPVAANVVSSTEALAMEERDYRQEKEESRKFYFNVIVTTAELKICCFSPDNISIKKGEIEEADFKLVPYVRFRKQLSLRNLHLTPQDYQTRIDPSNKKENTVFVVNSESLTEFLGDFANLVGEEFFQLTHY